MLGERGGQLGWRECGLPVCMQSACVWRCGEGVPESPRCGEVGAPGGLYG